MGAILLVVRVDGSWDTLYPDAPIRDWTDAPGYKMFWKQACKIVGPPEHGIFTHLTVVATHSSRDGLFGKDGSRYKKDWTGTITGYDEKQGKYEVRWDEGCEQSDGTPLGPDGKRTLISHGKFKVVLPSKTGQYRLDEF